MSVPSPAEHRLTFGLVCALGAALGLAVLLTNTRGSDDAVTARPDSSPSSSPSTEPTTAPTTAPTTVPSRSPEAGVPTPRPTPSGSAPASSAGPTPPGSGVVPTQGPAAPTGQPDASGTPGPTQPPSPAAVATVPVITELPTPAAAVARLVPGFPAVLAPPEGAVVTLSGISNDGSSAEVSLVARSDEPVAAVVDHYRASLVPIGFAEARPRTDETGTTASFDRGSEHVLVTAWEDGNFSVHASVVPAPPVTGEANREPAADPAGDRVVAPEVADELTTEPTGTTGPTPTDAPTTG